MYSFTLKRTVQYAGLALLALVIAVICSSRASAQTIVSQVVQSPEGKYYLQKDGSPFLYLGIQNTGTTQLKGRYANDNPPYAPYPTPMPLSWLENAYEKTQALGYKVVQQQLTWSDLELTNTPGVYDWTIIDQYVDWANEYDLYIDIVWFGTNVGGGGVLSGYPYGWNTNVPPYLQNHNKYWNNGDGVGSGANTPHLPSHGTDAANLFAWERQTIRALFDHLAVYDTNHRVVLFQVNNEPNLAANYEANKTEWLSVLNRLAEQVKLSDYVVATRVNLAGYTSGDPDIKNSSPYIDFNGPDLYSSNVTAVMNAINDHGNSSLTYIPENAGDFGNSSSLTLTALVNGGFYEVYQLNDSWTFSNQGMLGATLYNTWTLGTLPPFTAQATDMKNLNNAMNKVGSLIAAAHPSRMAGYNIESDNPASSYNAFKSVAGKDIAFYSTDSSVGMVVNNGSYFYAVSDTANSANVYFTTKENPVSATYGYMDSSGNWVSQGHIAVVNNGNGTWKIPYSSQQAVRIELSPAEKFAAATNANNLFPASNAIDGSQGTAYVSADSQAFPEYLTLYYNQPQTFNRLSVSCDFCQGQGVTSYDVQVTTDGANWSTVGSSGTVSYTGNSAAIETSVVDFTAVTGITGIRIQINSANIQWDHFVVNEMTPSYSTGSSNTVTASATSVNGAFPASRAIDGDQGTAYVSADNPTFPQYLTLTNSLPQSYQQLSITCDFCQGQGITSFDVEVSTDGTSWSTAASSGTLSYTSNSAAIETKTVSFAPVTGIKAIRIKINSANLLWNHFVVNEIQTS